MEEAGAFLRQMQADLSALKAQIVAAEAALGNASDTDKPQWRNELSRLRTREDKLEERVVQHTQSLAQLSAAAAGERECAD